jgi:hypothetical protein
LNVSNSHILSDRLAAPTLMWGGRGVEAKAWEGEGGELGQITIQTELEMLTLWSLENLVGIGKKGNA